MAYVGSASRANTITALLLIALATDALAQSDTLDHTSGNRGGGSFTDGQSSFTISEDAGPVTGRTETNSDGTATVYDSSGRVIGYEMTKNGNALLEEAEGPVGGFARSR
jgi:hypothetical protein